MPSPILEASGFTGEDRATAVQSIATACLVGLCVWFSLTLAGRLGQITPIWIANAVWLTFLLKAPRRRWPSLLLAGLFGDVVVNRLIHDTWFVALGLGAVNAVEVLICAVGVAGLVGPRFNIKRPRDLLTFGLVATASAFGAALLGATWLSLAHGAEVWRHAAVWSLADALGLLIFTPPLLLAGSGELRQLLRPPQVRRAAMVLATIVLTLGGAALLPQHPIMLVGPPILVLAALQLEFAGVALAMLVVAAATMVLVYCGWTPVLIAGRPAVVQVFWMQAYLLMSAIVTFPIASVLASRRALEGELVKSRDFAREAMRQAGLAEEISRVGHWRYDFEASRMFWSEQMYKIYGVNPADGQPDVGATVEFCHPDDRERLQAHRVRNFADDADIEVRIIRPDGEVRHVMPRGTVERDESGKVIARFGTLADVTEIKRAEAAAKESEQRYRFLAEFAPDMITRTKLAGEVIYVSPSSMRVFGYTPEEMAIQNAQEMVHPEDFDGVMAGIFRLIEERIQRLPEPMCYRARHKDGHWIWIETNPTLIFDPLTGEPTEFIDIVRDVTQTKTFEAELERARKRAEAAAAAKSAFLANMSHELRTPLTSIVGFSRLMGDRDDLSTETRHFAKRISDASVALLAVINDVLDFSKLEAGQFALEIQPLSMRRLVEESTGLIAIQAAAKGLEVHTEFDPNLPDQVTGDIARLRQVLLNFLSNAVKFTESGGVSIKVAYADRGEPGHMRVSVTDTGAGIPPDGVAKLFERFSQAEISINRTHGGTGLGLAICKGITELMGGEIGVDTEEGKGSTFWFDVPAPPAAAAQPEVTDVASPEVPALRLLVVDDTPVNRELVRLMLTPLGLDIEEAGGGAEAVRLALARPFDLILMDVRMPGVDGLEATRVIRATSVLNARTPILALTADVQTENYAACREAGMDDVVAKPISPKELITKILRHGAAGERHPDTETAVLSA